MKPEYAAYSFKVLKIEDPKYKEANKTLGQALVLT